MAVTDTWLKAQVGKPRPKVEEKADRGGLSVRVSPKGKVVFQMRYRYNNKPGRLDLGSYPLMGLKAAREECQRLRAKLEKGHNPKVVTLLEKKELRTAHTLQELFYEWYEGYCKPRKKNYKRILRSFEIHVLPDLGKLPAKEVTLHDWLGILEPLARRVAGIASRILVNVKQMYKWGIRRRLVSDNPMSDISAVEDLHIRQRPRKRVLNEDEIRLLWRAIHEATTIEKNRLFLKLILIYGCRHGELRLAERGHFNFDEATWTIPAENHKVGYLTGNELRRPITKDTAPLIERAFALSLSSVYMFTCDGSAKQLSHEAASQTQRPLINWIKRELSTEMEHFTVHDLRRTARTGFSPLTDPHIAELMLGHKLPGEWQTYDLYKYLEEQRVAYEKWYQRVVEIAGN